MFLQDLFYLINKFFFQNVHDIFGSKWKHVAITLKQIYSYSSLDWIWLSECMTLGNVAILIPNQIF